MEDWLGHTTIKWATRRYNNERQDRKFKSKVNKVKILTVRIKMMKECCLQPSWHVHVLIINITFEIWVNYLCQVWALEIGTRVINNVLYQNEVYSLSSS